MLVGDASADAVRTAMSAAGVITKVGPLSVRFRSKIPEVASYVRSHYAAFPVLDAEGCHLTIDVQPTPGVRRVFGRQALFGCDGMAPFYPLPRHMAPALLEWGLNWGIGRRVHHLVVVHSAVVVRNGRAALLPAEPGSGKSTLCAALVAHGWQLGSDEFALIDPETSQIFPLPRPISLKERSIEIIAARMADPCFGPEVHDIEGERTRHLAPPAESVALADSPATGAWIVVPRYAAGSPTIFRPASRAKALVHLAGSSYNYNALGTRGFESLARIVDGASCHTLTYSNIDEALALFDQLAESRTSP